MDNNIIATLQDYKESIEKSFKSIEKELKEYIRKDASLQNRLLDSITNNQSTIKTNLSYMKMEKSNLKDENNIKKWEGIIEMLHNKHEEYKKRILELKNSKERKNTDDSIDINNNNIDIKKMSSKQVMNDGDKIIKHDGEIINNMKEMVDKDLKTMQGVNIELERQHVVLDNVDKDLKDIDYSLKRAGQQIRNILKRYATDKLIMCFIVVIILVILAIIIASIAGKKKDNSNENLPHDIFSSKNSNRKLKFLWDFH